jgi:hypothetical protein
MQTRNITRRDKGNKGDKGDVSLHQIDVDISGPLAQSLLAEHERDLAEENLTCDDEASQPIGNQGLCPSLNPDSTTNTKRSRSPDLSDSPERAKLVKTDTENRFRTYIRTVRAHYAKKNKNGFLNYIPRAVKYTTAQFGAPLIKKLKKFDAADFDATKPGFVANDYDKDAENFGKVYSVQELVNLGFRLIAWDGRFVKLFC